MTNKQNRYLHLSFKKFFLLFFAGFSALMLVFVSSMMLTVEEPPPFFICIILFIILIGSVGIIACFGALIISSLISYRIGEKGITQILFFIEKDKDWDEINKVQSSFFAYVLTSNPFDAIIIFAPWLFKDKEGMMKAIDRYAPKNHLIRKIIKS